MEELKDLGEAIYKDLPCQVINHISHSLLNELQKSFVIIQDKFSRAPFINMDYP